MKPEPAMLLGCACYFKVGYSLVCRPAAMKTEYKYKFGRAPTKQKTCPTSHWSSQVTSPDLPTCPTYKVNSAAGTYP